MHGVDGGLGGESLPEDLERVRLAHGMGRDEFREALLRHARGGGKEHLELGEPEEVERQTDPDSEGFEPRTEGCARHCPIIAEKEFEICCENSLACCFYCTEEDCPVKGRIKDMLAGETEDSSEGGGEEGESCVDADSILDRLEV